MKKIISLFALLICFYGCSNDNKITVENIAKYSVYFNFRAQIYRVPGTAEAGPNGGSYPIRDIPNGTFTYKTMWEFPDNLTIAPAAESDGELIFNKKSTAILIQYGSVLSNNTYTTSATITSSDSKNPVSSQ